MLLNHFTNILNNSIIGKSPQLVKVRANDQSTGGASMTTIIPPKKCVQCGKVFQPIRKTKEFCSRLCSHNNWVDRHKEGWKEYNEQWRETHPNYWREYYKDGRGVEVQKRRHAKHPLNRKARGAVSSALNSGRLIKPLRCEICGCVEKLEAHHYKGYEKEHWLDVQWLCHEDHLKADNG
jgi:hypothetical protein